MDLLKLYHGFVKVVLCISSPFPHKKKLKFGQDFKFCWSFYFELKVLNESNYSIPQVHCAFGNVFINSKFSDSISWMQKHVKKYFPPAWEKRQEGKGGARKYNGEHFLWRKWSSKDGIRGEIADGCLSWSGRMWMSKLESCGLHTLLCSLNLILILCVPKV